MFLLPCALRVQTSAEAVPLPAAAAAGNLALATSGNVVGGGLVGLAYGHAHVTGRQEQTGRLRVFRDQRRREAPMQTRTQTPGQASGADRLRHDIDRGLSGDKVNVEDPAAAPLGTDDEAAGSGPTTEQVRLARRAEIDRRPNDETAGRRIRTVPGMVGSDWPAGTWRAIGLGTAMAAAMLLLLAIAAM